LEVHFMIQRYLVMSLLNAVQVQRK